MKVHPVPRKRNITLRYDIVSALSQANGIASGRQKKLRRLPHIFAKVLELPFHSDAEVSIQESPDSLRFVIPTDDNVGDNIRAHTVEIYPGVTKIVIRGDNVLDSSLGEFELDLWRFRLPPSTLPELATAAFNDGELVVTVPKDPLEDDVDAADIGEAGRLILVVGQYIYPSEAGGGGDEERAARYPTRGVQEESVTIGEALEAAALSAGDKPVEESDAAAIQAAEARATGLGDVVPGGIGAEAQHAAAVNARTIRQDKTTLGDVLTDATSKLIDDKPVTKADAESVVGAEIRNKPDLATHPGGVAASVVAAANLNKF